MLCTFAFIRRGAHIRYASTNTDRGTNVARLAEGITHTVLDAAMRPLLAGVGRLANLHVDVGNAGANTDRDTVARGANGITYAVLDAAMRSLVTGVGGFADFHVLVGNAGASTDRGANFARRTERVTIAVVDTAVRSSLAFIGRSTDIGDWRICRAEVSDVVTAVTIGGTQVVAPAVADIGGPITGDGRTAANVYGIGFFTTRATDRLSRVSGTRCQEKKY